MRITTRLYTLVLILTLACAAVPSQAGLFNIDEDAELRMGKEAAQQIESLYTVDKDPRLQDLVNDVGLRVASVSARPHLQWEFKVLDVPEVNALSVPGYVYVNKGLLNLIKNDRDELAAVIAHEIGHTTGRHAARQIEKEIAYSIALSFLHGNAAQFGSLAANLSLLGYSRKDEYDADRRGVHLMGMAGFDLHAMNNFFRQLQIQDPDNSSKIDTYFRTHPPTNDRIGRIEKEINGMRLTPVANTQTNMQQRQDTSYK